MRTHDLNHLSDTDLLHELRARLTRERDSTAAVLPCLAEVDARKLYLPAGYPSMFEYCVHEFGLSEDSAYKRIRAARAGRRVPAVFDAVAEGRLHLSAVVVLAPHLSPENARELLGAATGKSKAEVEKWLAERFPRSELLTMVEALPGMGSEFRQLAPGPVQDSRSVSHGPDRLGGLGDQLTPGPVQGAKLTPQAAQRFALHVTISQGTHDRLRHAQELLAHRIPSGDVAQVLDLALATLVERLEKTKFAASRTPRPRARRSNGNPRHIPAHVKRTVWERDQGRCTFVSPTGHRCGARKFLEFDHVETVARGGQATVAGIRLRCRAHNQFEAERAFGSEFMNRKRDTARRTAAEARLQAADAGQHSAAQDSRTDPPEPTPTPPALAVPSHSLEPAAPTVAATQDQDLMACLRQLGFRAGEVRSAIDFCETVPATTLEERVRTALKFLRPNARTIRPVAPGLEARM